jgi:hypothetical protein
MDSPFDPGVGTVEAVYGSAHLKGFMRYAELADAIEKWLEETGRR